MHGWNNQLKLSLPSTHHQKNTFQFLQAWNQLQFFLPNLFSLRKKKVLCGRICVFYLAFFGFVNISVVTSLCCFTFYNLFSHLMLLYLAFHVCCLCPFCFSNSLMQHFLFLWLVLQLQICSLVREVHLQLECSCFCRLNLFLVSVNLSYVFSVLSFSLFFF